MTATTIDDSTDTGGNGTGSPGARGLFIALEGGEGSGKSTLAEALTSTLTARGHDVITTREPGGTPTGRSIRALLLDPSSDVSPRTEALLYAADRAHHVQTLIEPHLQAAGTVITDRYVDSTLAYQGGGRNIATSDLIALQAFATGGLVPDLTILLDVDPTIGIARAGRSEFGAADRIEAEDLDFHTRVRERFLTLAHQHPDRYLICDATQTPDTITQQAQDAVLNLLRQRAA